MFSKSYARSSLHIFSLCLVLTGMLPEARAQLLIKAKVQPNAQAITSSAEIYDPASKTFTPVTATMNARREVQSAVLLRNGVVFIDGGYNGISLATAENYDPATGKFSVTASTSTTNTIPPVTTTTVTNMSFARRKHTATLLQDGRVFIAGGFDGSLYQNTAEIYDPSAQTFTATTNNMTATRGGHTATLLSDGTVLLAGGYDGSSFLASAEIYAPNGGTFTTTSGALTGTRTNHTATLLQDGTVLLVGGENTDPANPGLPVYLSSAEIFTLSSTSFASTGGMATPRIGHTATLLQNGKVLISGGFDGSHYLNTAEIYDPASKKFTSAGAMTVSRTGHSAVLLADGKVLITGGYNGSYLNSAELFDPTSGTFTALPNRMNVARSLQTATVLNNGRVLIAGGQSADLLVFGVNATTNGNVDLPCAASVCGYVSPNIIFTADSSTGFTAYTGSGVVLAFSPQTGQEIKRIQTGGFPIWSTPLPDGQTLAVVSAFDNRVFIIDMKALTVRSIYTFSNAQFGFGSNLAVSPDGSLGYVSSTGTGQVIKFRLSDGREQGRWTGLQNPTQITVSKDGSLVLVVDFASGELDAADTSSMTTKWQLKATSVVSTALLTLNNNSVLSGDGNTGVVTAQDSSGSRGYAFIFKTSTGEIIDQETVGTTPGYTGISPNGQIWAVLNSDIISIIPTSNPKGIQNVDLSYGQAVGSSYISFSKDSRYAFYSSSANDFVFQIDLKTTGINGKVLVGDDPNKGLNNPASVAVTPDGKIAAAAELVAEDIDLLTGVTQLTSTKYVISGNQFSGLSLVNLSSNPTTFTIYALDDNGVNVTGTNLTNPVLITLGPNAQTSQAISQIFNFDLSTDQIGRLMIYADQPQVAAYTSTGQIRATWLGYYLSKLDGAPLIQQPTYDFLAPQILTGTGQSVQMEFVNPNYAQQNYEIKHFSKDGTLTEDKPNQTIGFTIRTESGFSDLFTAGSQNKVLLTGGQSTTAAGSTLSSAENYDVTGKSFAASSSSMTVARQGQSSTLLLNNDVLVAGGKNASGTILATAETYNLVTTKSISTITRDSSGIVTLTFTGNVNWNVGAQIVVAGVLHDPSIDTFDGTFTITTISFNSGSGITTITYSNSGAAGSGTAGTGLVTFNSGGAFTATAGTMTVERHRHSATLLQDGKVLLAGGQNSTSVNTSAEVYDPSFGTFAATAGTMTTPRDSHTGTLLNSGKVLIAGGIDGNVVSGTAELFDPASGLFTPTGPMTTKRVFHTATLLQNGRVLIAGGFNGTYLNTAELYDTATGTFRSTAGVMSSARSGHTATLLSDGRVLIAGGINSSDSVETAALNTADIYDPSSDTFAPVANPLNGARTNHTATLLSDGTVLLTGGTGPCTTCCPTGSSSTSCPGALNTTEIFDPAAQTFAQGPTMTVARSGHAATYLQSTTAGYVRVSCPPGMAFSETYGGTGDIGMINGIEVSKYAGITKLYSPQFANTPAFSTRLNLINANTNNKDAQVTITLHGPDGKVLGTPLDLTIPRNGQLEDNIDNIFANDPAIKNATGWLEVDSSIDQVVGTVTFTDADSVILTSLELSGNPLTNLVFPIVAEDATYETGVALLNTNSSAANVTVELWGPNGTINRSTTISVAPGTRTAEFLSDFFPGLSALLVGNIRVHSDQPIHSFGLMMDRDLNFVLAIPAVPFPAAP